MTAKDDIQSPAKSLSPKEAPESLELRAKPRPSGTPSTYAPMTSVSGSSAKYSSRRPGVRSMPFP